MRLIMLELSIHIFKEMLISLALFVLGLAIYSMLIIFARTIQSRS